MSQIGNLFGTSNLIAGTTPIAGTADKQVLYSDAGILQGAIGLEWDKTLALLSVGGAGGLRIGGAGAAAFLFGDAADSLGQRNGATPQRFSVYNTFTSQTNYERFSIEWDANRCAIKTASGGGGGTNRSLDISASDFNFMVYSVGGCWNIPSTGHLVAAVTNTFDIGASAGFKPRTLYLGTSIVTPGGASFHTTSTALTDGAAGSVGTLTNAPAAGNPTKWIGINDNGTVRQIPSW